jgi:hypothetical protein
MPQTSPPGVLCLAVLFGGISACTERRVSIEPPAEAVDEVTIRVDIGIVEIVPGRTLRVEQVLRAPKGAVVRSERVVDGHLQVEARCKSPVFCSVDTRIRLPVGTSISVDLHRGEVWATGVGDLDIELGTGSLDLEVTGAVRGRVGQGQIRVETAADQLVRLAVGQGDIDLTVPRSPWRVDIQAADTQLAGVNRSRNARGALELTAPSGVVRVRATGGPVDSGSPNIP